MMNFTFAVFLLKSIMSSTYHLGELSNYTPRVLLPDHLLAAGRNLRQPFLTYRAGSTL